MKLHSFRFRNLTSLRTSYSCASHHEHKIWRTISSPLDAGTYAWIDNQWSTLCTVVPLVPAKKRPKTDPSLWLAKKFWVLLPLLPSRPLYTHFLRRLQLCLAFLLAFVTFWQAIFIVPKGKHIWVQAFRRSSSNVPKGRHIQGQTVRHSTAVLVCLREAHPCTSADAWCARGTHMQVERFGTPIWICSSRQAHSDTNA